MSGSPETKRGQQAIAPVPAFFVLLLFAAAPIRHVGAEAVLWTAPAILLASMLIAWAAESAQFFIAQGFALAILAWLQTLPEFAVEAVLAWKQQAPLLLANLTGALRLLTGLGWPMIYAVAAFYYRRRNGKAMGRIRLEANHAVEVIGLLAPLIYFFWIWWKSSLSLIDAAVLTLIYVVYLVVLAKIPPEEAEGIDELELIPRTVAKMERTPRVATIFLLFLAGGALIYFMAEPFLGSLLSLSTAIGVPSFVFIQWLAPFVSEFPEKVSAFYWARTVDKAAMALMNMVSSNINQWTLLAAMLPVLYSFGAGTPMSIPFDDRQRLEILMTLGQSLVGMLFLINMELAWWEAATLFTLFITQFVLSAVPPGPGPIGFLAEHIHAYTTAAYFIWAGVEVVRLIAGKRKPIAVHEFRRVWREHIRPA